MVFDLGFVRNNQPLKALSLFEKVEHPNEIILTIVFNACAKIQSAESLEVIKKVCAKMPRSCLHNQILLTSLIDAFVKCGDMSSAETYFEQLKTDDVKMSGGMMKGTGAGF